MRFVILGQEHQGYVMTREFEKTQGDLSVIEKRKTQNYIPCHQFPRDALPESSSPLSLLNCSIEIKEEEN